ncbi:BLUF domain-containing protein [Sphingomonas sp.]|uniref:BLUF domain-containing protein n=1 Tax=Sphingomonas sp. TaxID=28214 RepID=UPI0035BC8CB9
MQYLIYRSTPLGFDRAMLAGILLGARRNNARDAITGALLCRHDLYLQLIEGPAPAIDALYARIAVDDRHSDVRLLLSDTADRRMFPDWTMLDDQNPSLAWSPAQVADGAIEAAGAAELLGVFARLSASAACR